MASNTITKDLGIVTAYAEAVAGGYQGTRAQFQQMLARLANSYLDYSELENKPSINNVELVGNKTTSQLNISYNDLKDKPSIGGDETGDHEKVSALGQHITKLISDVPVQNNTGTEILSTRLPYGVHLIAYNAGISLGGVPTNSVGSCQSYLLGTNGALLLGHDYVYVSGSLRAYSLSGMGFFFKYSSQPYDSIIRLMVLENAGVDAVANARLVVVRLSNMPTADETWIDA